MEKDKKPLTEIMQKHYDNYHTIISDGKEHDSKEIASKMGMAYSGYIVWRSRMYYEYGIKLNNFIKKKSYGYEKYKKAITLYVKDVGTYPRVMDIANRLHVSKQAVDSMFSCYPELKSNENKDELKQAMILKSIQLSQDKLDKLQNLADRYQTTKSQIIKGIICRHLDAMFMVIEKEEGGK